MVIKLEEEININGTLIWYFNICKRETWFILRQLTPDQNNSFLELGRLVSESTYREEKKEVHFDNMVFDLVKTKDNNVIVGEVKKSSKFLESSKMQLAYYLYKLGEKGINARGELLFPKEKKKLNVELDEEIQKKLNTAIKEIRKLARTIYPPKPEKCKYCKNCAYYFLCWS